MPSATSERVEQPLVPRSKFRKFRVMGGTFVSPVYNDDGSERLETSTDGLNVTTKVSQVFQRGEIVESPIDLMRKFGWEKFQAIDDRGQTPFEPPKPKMPAKEVSHEADRADLETMTVQDLRRLAQEEEIDLGTAIRKEEIINTILASKELA